jgi:hypothetical protein
MKPGEVQILSEPQLVGRMPVRTELAILPDQPRGPSDGEKEFAEHGSIALRVFMSADDPRDNLVDFSWTLKVGGSVLVRGKGWGWFMTDLEKDQKGWFVRVNVGPLGSTSIHAKEPEPVWRRLDVTKDHKRGLWVVRELI